MNQYPKVFFSVLEEHFEFELLLAELINRGDFGLVTLWGENKSPLGGNNWVGPRRQSKEYNTNRAKRVHIEALKM